jgi:hypothetical protein
VDEVVLYAWVGEDEFGSGEIGLKQGLCPAGIIPLVAVNQEKMTRFQSTLQKQVNKYGKTIRLCKFVFSEVIIELEPQ